MKKIISAILCLLIILTVALCVCACNDDTQGSGSYTGKYYKYENNIKDPDSWIELKAGGKWTDGDDSGTYKIKDGRISIMVDGEELMSGTIGNGVLVLDFWGMETTYKKDVAGGNDDPDPKPSIDEYTVTFYLNYGSNVEEKRQTTNKKVTYVPTRAGYTFNGWWTINGTDSTGAPIFSRRWNMSDEVTSNDLVLYADWYETVAEGQLRPPTVIINGYNLRWESIPNAEGYNVIVNKDNEEISSETINRTSWSFDQSLECGVYTVSIRANGNGVNSTNSSYVTKTIRHKILDGFESLTYNKADATITWSEVEGATEYSLSIDHIAQEIAPDVFVYSVAYLDAGEHSVTIYAEREGWQPSSRTLTFVKDKLKTPDDVRASFNRSTGKYVIVWSGVSYADSYKIYEGNKLIDTVTEPICYIDAINWGNTNETTKTIRIISFDSKANYLQSTYSQPIELDRMANVSVEANDDNAGNVSASVSEDDSITLTFDYNYKDCPEPLVKKMATGTSFDYPIPTREGYTFSGWFEDVRLSKRYDFSKSIGMDTTFYAGWYAIEINKLNLNQQYRVSTTTSTQTYTFISYVSGTYTLYYRNGRSGQRTNVSLREETNTTYNPGYQTNTTNNSLAIDVTPGNIYSFVFSAYSSSYTGDFYFEIQGQEKPDCRILANAQDGNNFKLKVGETITMTAETNPGYTWLGWYNGDTKLTDELTYSTQVKISGNHYTAKWYKINIVKNMEEAGGIVAPNGKYVPGNQATITASTNEGYTWLGWYDGDTKVSEGTSFSYTFAMPSENKTFTAKWCKVTLDTNLSDAGSVSSLNEKYVPGDQATITATTNSGYTWLGWYDGDTKVSEGTSLSYTFTMPSENITYTAKWTFYTVTTETNMAEAGTYTLKSLEKVTAGEMVTLTATTNHGYTWLGWYDGETKVSEGTSLSYTLTMPSENKTLTAKWMECPITLQKNVDEAGSVSGLSTTILGAETTITATTNNGYTWLGWYDGDTKVSEGTSYSYSFVMSNEQKIYTAKWSKVTISTNDKLAGSITPLTDKYVLGEQVTITASTNNGYTWLGWYDGEIKVSEGISYSYTFVMSDENKTYTAKWSKVTILRSNSNSGNVTSLSGKYLPGDEVTITASTNLGYTWLGWYDGETKVSEGTDLAYTFNMPYENKTYTAKWQVCEDMRNFVFSSTQTTCTITDIRNSAITSLVVPNYVTSIDGAAFNGCGNLVEMTIPFVGGGKTSTSTIGSSSFGFVFGKSSYSGGIAIKQNYGNSYDDYVTYYIPSSLKKVTVTSGNIPFAAFFNCSNLTNITISDSATKIASYSFYGCSNLTSVIIGKGVKEIGNYAFYECRNLTSIIIPGSVISIGKAVFSGCSSLKCVYYKGSATDWEKMSIGSYNGAFTDAIRYYYSETRPMDDYNYWHYVDDVVTIWIRDYYILSTNTIFPEAGTYTQMNAVKTLEWNLVTLTASTNNGYTWLGWYDGDTKVSEGTSLSYTFSMPSENKTYTAKWCKVTLNTNLSAAGSVSSLSEKYVPGDQATITASTNNGYTWLGWYDGDTKVSEGTSLSYTFSMPSENKTYTAKWCKVTLNTNLSAAGSVSSLSEKYVPGDQATITASTNMGYEWLGWYDGETKVSENDSTTYTFTMPYESKNFIAKWQIRDGMSMFNFTATQTTCAITGINDSMITSIVVPDYVTSIASGAFKDCSKLTSITLPFIGETKDEMTNTHFGYIFGASNYNDNSKYVPSILKEVIITAAKSISDYAFYGCSGLMSITIPNGVNNITGSSAFAGCSILTIYCETANKLDGWESGWNSSRPVVWNCKYNDVASDGNIYVEISGIRYAIKDNVSRVIMQSKAISGAIEMPSTIEYKGEIFNVSSIDFSAFKECNRITSVTIPNSVTCISYEAFYGCTKLTSIAIPDSVTIIGSDAFSGCSGLTNVKMSSNVTEFLQKTFYNCTKLTSINIPNNVTTIGKEAFSGCSGLTNINIPNSVTSIGSYAFEDCSGLTSITIPDSVTSIGSYAFYNCSGLTRVTLGNNVKIIKSLAFSGCSGLTNIKIPESTTHIGDAVFYECSQLTSIVFEDSTTWYRTTNMSHWESKINGTQIDVTNAADNVQNLSKKSYTYAMFWYKR